MAEAARIPWRGEDCLVETAFIRQRWSLDGNDWGARRCPVACGPRLILCNKAVYQGRLAIVRIADDEQVWHPMVLRALQEVLKSPVDGFRPGIANPPAAAVFRDPLILRHVNSSVAKG